MSKEQIQNCLAALNHELRAIVEATDREDVKFLIALLHLQTPQAVFAILEKYYPKQQIKPATQYFIEELFAT